MKRFSNSASDWPVSFCASTERRSCPRTRSAVLRAIPPPDHSALFRSYLYLLTRRRFHPLFFSLRSTDGRHLVDMTMLGLKSRARTMEPRGPASPEYPLSAAWDSFPACSLARL